jgi:arylsulfatase A
MNAIKSISLCVLGLVSYNSVKEKVPKNEKLPNIIHIFADDLGYSDLSCFGATDIKTSNIDRIACEGIRFTEFYSASPVCSPSRAALLTGRLPQRMGINNVFFPESFTGMPQNEITIAEMLKEKNYVTGIIGKWHLGHHYKFLPLQQGFDSYFGIPYSNDMESVLYMRGNDVEEFNVDQRYITKRYTEEAVKFIDQNRNNPFFLYIAHNMPHVPIYASEDFLETSERGLYGDVVQELDWSVGQILEKLEQLNLLNNTLVIFSSDNGPWLVMEDHGGSAGILREGKQYTFEGGMRVPTVAMWKSKIPEGIVYNDIASQMDWFPTIAKITGINLPEDLVIDGKDISNVLFNKGRREDSTFMYFDGADLQCYRKGNWKIKKPYEGYEGSIWKKAVKTHDTLLIDLKKDPGERNNLYEKYPDKTQDLFKEMNIQYRELGELPPSLVTRTEADNSHYEYLKNKKKKNKP